MKRYAPAIVMLLPALLLALGSDHDAGPLDADKWPAGLKKLVNADNRVHGYFVNAEDVFFFRGDTKALNVFLAKYAELPGTQLSVVLHAGKLEVRSPWDKSPRDVSAQWTLTTVPAGWSSREEAASAKPGQFIARVDIWIGDSIRLPDLQIPASLSVKSAGEIEAFIKQRDTTAK